MLNGEGKDTVSSSSLSPKNNGAANTSQTEATVSSPMKMNVNKAGVTPESTDKEENVSKEVMNEEDEIAGMNNGKIAVDKEKNEETAKEEEENTMEKDEKNESNALEEDGEENEMEEEDDGGGEEEEGEEEDGEGEEEDGEGEEAEEEEYDIEGEEEDDAVGEEEEDDDGGEEREEEKDVDKEQQEDKKEENQDKSVEQAKNEEEVGPNSKEKRLRKQGRKKKVAQKGSETVAAKIDNKPGPSDKKKVSKRSESMGMIFMCSSKTKKDCYRYKVLGLPASKRDIVQKIYKGMRLFLYDFDVRLMYGIYKAAGPGGYNIEPKAFKSAFPSQVRFTVLDDCLPLPEEKFKKVIKDNYYTKNKFNCQLNSEQVKNLCKLFVADSRGSKAKKLGRNSRAETDKFKDRDRVRRRNVDEERPSSSGVKRRYRDRPYDRPYERERYGSRTAPLTRLPPPAPESYSSYGRSIEMDVYRRDRLVHRRDHRVSDLDLRLQDEIGSRDPYISYREPPPYRDPLYSTGDCLYSTGLRPEYNPPAGLLVDYRRPASSSEYGPLRPLYRY